MKTSQKGQGLIHSFESCAEKRDGLIYPYRDMVGVWTIGWGNTWYPDGRRVSQNDSPITQAEADKLFEQILLKFEDGVNFLVKSPINQNQFDALVSFAYNVGLDLNHNGIAEGLGESTLLRKVNENPSDASIRVEFMKWDMGMVDGRLAEIAGLSRRRSMEADLYFS